MRCGLHPKRNLALQLIAGHCGTVGALIPLIIAACQACMCSTHFAVHILALGTMSASADCQIALRQDFPCNNLALSQTQSNKASTAGQLA